MPRVVANGLNLLGTRINNLGDGALPTDAVNLGQLQAYVTGIAWKQPVRAASTTNVTVTAPGTSIDGVTLAAGDRVLLKNQASAAENGIWVWQAAASTLTRATDADTAAELASAATFVREGAINADRAFVQTTDGTITVGTTGLSWAQFGGMTVYTGGNGVQVVGTTVSAVADPAGGLTVGANGIALNAATAVRKYAQNIGDGTSTTITVTHNLATTDVTWSLRYVATGETFDSDVVVTGANALTVTTAAALASGAARIVVHG